MSPLATVLLCIAGLAVGLFFNAMVLNPLTAANALRQLYKLPASQRQGEALRAVEQEWWNIVLVPAYVLAALVIIGCLGGGQ